MIVIMIVIVVIIVADSIDLQYKSVCHRERYTYGCNLCIRTVFRSNGAWETGEKKEVSLGTVAWNYLLSDIFRSFGFRNLSCGTGNGAGGAGLHKGLVGSASGWNPRRYVQLNQKK